MLKLLAHFGILLKSTNKSEEQNKIMLNKISKILKIISTVLLSLAVILAILMAGLRIFGLQIYTVLSPSMEPNFQTGSLIYVKEVDTADLKERDVITFRLTGSTTATHRIIEIIPDQDDPKAICFRTKGDNNKDADRAPVKSEDVLGKVIFTIPLLGYLAVYIQNPPGIYVAACFALALILLVLLSDMLGDNNKKDKEKQITLSEP